jgi:hypothetical protein
MAPFLSLSLGSVSEAIGKISETRTVTSLVCMRLLFNGQPFVQ